MCKSRAEQEFCLFEEQKGLVSKKNSDKAELEGSQEAAHAVPRRVGDWLIIYTQQDGNP